MEKYIYNPTKATFLSNGRQFLRTTGKETESLSEWSTAKGDNYTGPFQRRRILKSAEPAKFENCTVRGSLEITLFRKKKKKICRIFYKSKISSKNLLIKITFISFKRNADSGEIFHKQCRVVYNTLSRIKKHWYFFGLAFFCTVLR